MGYHEGWVTDKQTRQNSPNLVQQTNQTQLYSQQGLQGAVGSQSISQEARPADAGDYTQVEVQLGERGGLCNAAADALKVAVRQLAAAHRQQPHTVLLQALADFLDLGRRQQLPHNLD